MIELESDKLFANSTDTKGGPCTPHYQTIAMFLDSFRSCSHHIILSNL